MGKTRFLGILSQSMINTCVYVDCKQVHGTELGNKDVCFEIFGIVHSSLRDVVGVYKLI